MTAKEFERRLRVLALREGMTFATFAIVADARRSVQERRAARKDASLRQAAGGAGNAGPA